MSVIRTDDVYYSMISTAINEKLPEDKKRMRKPSEMAADIRSIQTGISKKSVKINFTAYGKDVPCLRILYQNGIDEELNGPYINSMTLPEINTQEGLWVIFIFDNWKFGGWFSFPPNVEIIDMIKNTHMVSGNHTGAKIAAIKVLPTTETGTEHIDVYEARY